MPIEPSFFAQDVSAEGREIVDSLKNSLLAGNVAGDRCDQHCDASHLVRILESFSLWFEKGPPMAGLFHMLGL